MQNPELFFYCRSRSNPSITHQVSAEFTEEELILLCDCAAGQRSLACHHITRLIENDASALSEPSSADQRQDLALFQTWLADTTCREDLQRLHQLEQAVKDHKRFKMQITEAIEGGWKRKSWLEQE